MTSFLRYLFAASVSAMLSSMLDFSMAGTFATAFLMAIAFDLMTAIADKFYN